MLFCLEGVNGCGKTFFWEKAQKDPELANWVFLKTPLPVIRNYYLKYSPYCLKKDKILYLIGNMVMQAWDIHGYSSTTPILMDRWIHSTIMYNILTKEFSWEHFQELISDSIISTTPFASIYISPVNELTLKSKLESRNSIGERTNFNKDIFQFYENFFKRNAYLNFNPKCNVKNIIFTNNYKEDDYSNFKKMLLGLLSNEEK